MALGIKPIASTWIPGEPFPEHLQGKADGVENIGFEPNLERLLLLKPDLILSNTRLQNIYTQLSHIAPTVALDHLKPPAPWQKTLEDLAKILDKEQESKKLINDYWQRIEQLKQALGDRRIHGCIMHLDIKDGKIWVQHNATELQIAQELAALGIPKQDIVLGFQAPYVREYTGFGVA